MGWAEDNGIQTVPAAGVPTAGPSPNAVAASMGRTFARVGQQQAQRGATGLLPLIGGTGGAIIGAPFGPEAAIPLSAALAAAGEAIRQGIEGGKPNPKSIATQGAVQGAATGIGYPVARGMSIAAEGLMSGAAKAAPIIQQKVADAFSRVTGRDVAASPELVAQKLLAEGIPIGPGFGTVGSQLLDARIGALANQANTVLSASPKTVTVFDAMGPVADLRAAVARETDGAAKLTKLDKMVGSLVEQLRDPRTASGQMGALKQLPLTDANALKQTWQGEADKIYSARVKGSLIPPGQELRARLAEAVAKGMRSAIENAAPEVAPLNARISTLMPLREAVQKSEMALSSGRAPFLPAAANLAIPPFLRGRAMMSRAALTLADPSVQFGLQQLLRSAGQVVAPTPALPPSVPGFVPGQLGAAPDSLAGRNGGY